MSKPKQPSFFIRSNPNAPQLCPDLAKEVGLNESILLLQWEYWIRSEAEERDGFLWLRKTERQIHQFFPFWATGSIHRIIQSLVKKGLLVAGSYDSGPGRGALWFRIDWDQIGKLQSLRVDCSNLEQRLLNSEAKSLQSGATVFNIDLKNRDIPANAETPPGYKQTRRKKTLLPDDFSVTPAMRNWAHGVGLDDDRIDNAHERYVRHVTKIEKVLYPEHWGTDWEEWMLNEVKLGGNGHRNGNGYRRVEEESGGEYPSFMAPPKPVDYFEKKNAEFRGK